jgi:hypothetical protein
MMLFDPSLDALDHSENTIPFIRHFFNADEEQEDSTEASQSPILVTSHRFFLLISEVTRLARAPRPLNDGALAPWVYLQAEILQREQDTPCEPSEQLFILAMQILLLRVHLTPSSVEIAAQIAILLSRGLTILDILDIQKYFSGYLLWPLTVFGSVASRDHERRAIEEGISHLVERQYGQAIRIYEWLKRLWALKHGSKTMTMMRGLRMLLGSSSNYHLQSGRDFELDT